MEDIGKKLSEARKNYAELLVPHLETLKSKKIDYEKMMTSLGVKKEMPGVPLPKELAGAGAEYFSLREKIKGDISTELSEVELLRREIIKASSQKVQEVVAKSQKGLNGLVGDLGLLSPYTAEEEQSYEGLRITEEEKMTTSVPFDGGDLKIVRKTNVNPQEITVLFEGKEIAKGVITEKGPEIEINQNLKHIPLMTAVNPEEKAFEVAYSFIKTLIG